MKLFFTSLFIILQFSTYAQSRISGQVSAAARPASFATVALLKAADSSLVKGMVCDSLGRFTLENVPYGSYLLAATQAGAGKTYSRGFIADSLHRQIMLDTLRLMQQHTLKEVAVNAQKPYVEMQIDKLVLNVENSVMAHGNMIFDLLIHAPGMRQDQYGNIVMMGKPGVQIWIDGRPSALTGESLSNWLKNQPADVVAKIEIITHPSSRYDAAGSAGIINIRLKKNVQQGINGGAYTSLSMGKYPKASTGVNMNYRKNKLNIFGDYSYSYSESYNYRTLNTVINNGSFIDYDNYWHPIGNYHYGKLGADYKPDAKTTIGMLLNGNISATNAITDANTAVYSDPLEKRYLVAQADGKDRWNNLSYNFNILREIDSLGSTFNLDADLSRYDKTAYDNILNWDRAGEKGQATQIAEIRSAMPVVIRVLSLKADYVKYFNKTFRIETGFKISRVSTDNDIRYDSLLQQVWEPDLNRSNHFEYTENIQAVYATVVKEWKQLTLQAGLRAERTDATGNSLTLGQKVQRRYAGFFPSLNVMKQINNNNQLTFSYSRRIDRPSYNSLNPFVVAIDPYNKSVGDPYLNAAYSNTFELRHGFRQFLWTTLYYSHGSKGAISLIKQDSLTKIQTTTFANLGSSDYGYLSVSISLPLTKWWQMDFNGGAGYAQYRSDIPGSRFTNGSWGAETGLDNTFTVFKNLKLMISMFYNTAAPSGQELQRANYGGRLSASKPVLNKRGRISFTLQDPFNMQRYDADIYTNASAIRWINRWESRRVSLGFSWKFGRQQIKAARDRKNGMGDVERRVQL
ncbi:Outer membrane receptor proteins, mostly Fe transport [Chitinophaga rupis]|uniref:Outer membrane receptor proteins, mostly Fe transport n=1 Tax=Chitinophaga rupis TaxID=573321 RepID=A0A1H8G7M3_9BACT|nr:outer membrane beta-barrel family protein [Chitinophaga rupis]SEN40022.1 Outer membrane receptor proteins, mostly Fe transport [Chitinophaga rupis]